MNYYVIELQTNSDETSGNLVYAFANRADAEDKYLALRQAANQSSVMIHAVAFIDNRGNTVLPSAAYIHPPVETEGERAE